MRRFSVKSRNMTVLGLRERYKKMVEGKKWSALEKVFININEQFENKNYLY